MDKEQTPGAEPVQEPAAPKTSAKKRVPNPQYVPALRKEYDFKNLSEADKAELKTVSIKV